MLTFHKKFEKILQRRHSVAIRSSLTADFEALVFIKGNLQLLVEKSVSAQLDMVDDGEWKVVDYCFKKSNTAHHI